MNECVRMTRESFDWLLSNHKKSKELKKAYNDGVIIIEGENKK